MQHQEISADELVGQTLGTCHVEQLLGRNRVSMVYLAQQPEQNRTVAVTLFRIPEQFSPSVRSRFMTRFTSEASALVLLNHPQILPIYEYGERFSYPYLVTPYVTDGSLANLLKQQKQCTPAYTLEILEQVAAGLDYAHKRGVIHGALKPSHILLRNAQRTQVAGFGLVRILEMRDINSSQHPHPELVHLLSIAGTFLGAPEYIAPEFVLGQPPDARSDIYALGIILFEMLSGKLPFTGTNPFEVAMQHVEQPLPSLRALCPDLSEELEQVILQALHRDPDQRFQHAGELASAFAQALQRLPQTSTAINPTIWPQIKDTPLPPANFLNEETPTTGRWQLIPPIVTGHLPVVNASMSDKPAIDPEAQSDPDQRTWQLVPPIVTGRLPAVQSTSLLPVESSEEDVSLQTVPVNSLQEGNLTPLDPSKERSSASSEETEIQSSPPLTEGAEQLSNKPQMESSKPRRKSSRKSKYVVMTQRKAVALLATGGIAAVGVGTLGGISLAHLLENNTHPQTAAVSTGTPPPTGKPIPKTTSNPIHTGTVIGNTTQPLNSANNFNNPVDDGVSLLIHLPNSSFVAFEKACTHEGVPVRYDPVSHTLICPAHFSVFDPANGGKVLQGPANKPLSPVAIRVNADGTITTD